MSQNIYVLFNPADSKLLTNVWFVEKTGQVLSRILFNPIIFYMHNGFKTEDNCLSQSIYVLFGPAEGRQDKNGSDKFLRNLDAETY